MSDAEHRARGLLREILPAEAYRCYEAPGP